MSVKFLIIRLSSIGDIVLTSPVARCLKEQVQHAEIHFATKIQYSCIVEGNPHISKVHVLREDLSDLIRELKHENFDYIIDLHNNFRTFLIKRNLGKPSFSFHKLNLQKLLLVKLKINRLPKIHIVDRYLDTVASFGVKNDGNGLDYFIPSNEIFGRNDLPSLFRKGYIAFVIAGTYFTKRLPTDKISEICMRTDYPVILLGGEKEKKEGEKVLSQSKGNVLNYAGKISLNQSASLVKEANLVLANDTGLMHIAAAFHKKVLSFWGNTAPDFGMYPYLSDHASLMLEVDHLKCRPCSKLGYKKCPKKHFKCMNNLDTGKAVEWINKNFND